VSEQKAEPKKKKKTKRSNKSRKTKNQAANPFILDPVIGQQLLLGVEQGQYGLGSLGDGSRGYNPLTNLLSGSQGGGPNFMNNPQVHDLLEKLGEQVLAQQQQ
jgi:predicted nucleotidyltransferase